MSQLIIFDEAPDNLGGFRNYPGRPVFSLVKAAQPFLINEENPANNPCSRMRSSTGLTSASFDSYLPAARARRPGPASKRLILTVPAAIKPRRVLSVFVDGLLSAAANNLK
jgi:hypothetical protein